MAPMHGHPPNVVVQLSDGKACVRVPDGTSQNVDLRSGETLWSGGGLHEVENVGEREIRRIIVELKR
ncbi:MAG: hypothetical protein ACYDFT_03060 [Thermoplasmata archaeon]